MKVWLAIVWVCWSWSGSARAERVTVEVEGCQSLLRPGELEDALGVELRDAEQNVRDYISRSRPRARIHCGEGEITVEVVASDGVALRESVQSLRLGLTRFVAIAIAESLAARASLPPPKPLVAVAAGPVVVGLPAAALDPSPRLAAWMSLTGWFWRGGKPAWWGGGGDLAIDLLLRSLITLHLDVALSDGVVTVDPGRIQARIPSVGLGVRLGHGRRWFRADAGGSFRGGAVLWTGQPDSTDIGGRSAVVPWLGAEGALILSADLSSRVRLRLQTTLGGPIASASADGLGMQLAGIAPIWITAGLGLAVRVGP